MRQSFSHGRTNTVQVERKKRRIVMPGEAKSEPQAERRPRARVPRPSRSPSPRATRSRPSRRSRRPRAGLVLRQLSGDEIDARARALADARVHEAEERRLAEEQAVKRNAEAVRAQREREDAERRKVEEEARRKTEEALRARAEDTARRRLGEEKKPRAGGRAAGRSRRVKEGEAEDEDRGGLRGKVKTARPAEPKPVKRGEERRRGKLTAGQRARRFRARPLARLDPPPPRARPRPRP